MITLATIGAILIGAGALLYYIIGGPRHGQNDSGAQLQLGASEVALRGNSITGEPCRTIRVYFIKPSRYDEEGYVQFFRYGVQPNNTLTVLKALNEAFNQRYAAQRNVYLETVIWDEICDGVVSPETISAIKEKASEDGVELLIGMAGVQSNQYPRGRDLALQFVAKGMTVMMGGFHVSGYPESRTFLNSCGITTIVGEAENLWGAIIEDYLRGELQPNYSVTEGIRAKTGQDDIIVPVITESHLPKLDDRYLTRFFSPTLTTIDTSRGCPFTCSYCSVKNVMGRTMRSREPNAVVEWVRDAVYNHGIESLFLVDDDFFRSPRWEEILTGLIEIKKEVPKFCFMMQVDVDASCYANLEEGETETAKHRRSRRFVDLAARAGCYQAFVGIESLNPENLKSATKYQNVEDRQGRMTFEEARRRVLNKYRRVVENWHRVGVSVHAGYMLGFPFDGVDCGRVAAKTLKKLGFDMVSFFIMTPLPGTEDQVRFVKEGQIVDWDFNNLDSQHVTLSHPKLDRHSWLEAYRAAFQGFYSLPRLIREVLTVCGGRGLAGETRRALMRQWTYYFFSYRAGRHPMVGGVWPIRRRDVRRNNVITDEEARRYYLGGLRFDAILRGEGDRFATAPA